MKHVLLVCGQGISSHLFLAEAERIAETLKVEIAFTATSATEITSKILAGKDLVLLAPQVSYQKEMIDRVGTQVPVAVIPNDIYGWLNSQRLVRFTEDELASVASPA